MSYYSLPSINCNDRKNILKKIFQTEKERCENLNPNKIYNSLYPGFENPLNKFNTINGEGESLIGATYNLTEDQCAQDCLTHISDDTDNKCNYFRYDKETNICDLYSTDEFIDDDNENSSRGTNKKLYKRTSNTSCSSSDSNCTGCSSICDGNLNNNFKQIEDNMTINELNKLGQSLGVNNLQTCMQKCYDNSSCKSFIYKQNKSKCSLYSNKKNNSTKNLYEIKSNLGNKIDLSYEKTYNNYKKGNKDYNGKVGDYFCEYDNTNNICNKTEYKSCSKDSEQVVSEESLTKHINLQNSIDNIPKSSTGNPLKINNLGFNKCIKGKNGCVGNLFTYDNLGFPQYYRTANPSTQNYMFANSLKEHKNKKILNCPSGYIASSYRNNLCHNFENNQYCIPNNVDSSTVIGITKCTYNNNDDSLMKSAPNKTKFNNPERCNSWCNNRNDCYAVSSTQNKNKKYYQKDNNNNYYIKKPNDDTYIYDTKDYTQREVFNQTPLQSNLVRILHSSKAETSEEEQDRSFKQYTSCLTIPRLNNKEKNALISISKVCQNQFGKGYVAHKKALCNKIECKTSDNNKKYRYACTFDPTDNINIYNIGDTTYSEHFNNFSTKNTPSYIPIVIILLIFLIIIFLFKINKY